MPYKNSEEFKDTYSVQREISDGTLSRVLLRIPYFDKRDIIVTVDDEEVLTVEGKTKYVYSWDNFYIDITPAVDKGSELMLRRSTNRSTMLNVFNGQAEFTDESMDENFRQLLYLAQEFTEGAALKDVYGSMNLHGTLNMEGYRITNVATPVEGTDASNKNYVDTTLDLNIGAIEAVRDQAREARDQAREAEANAKDSENKAKTSEINSKRSEETTKQYLDATKVSELNAQTSAGASVLAADESRKWANTIQDDWKKAEKYASEALASANSAKESEVKAQASVGASITASKESREWAETAQGIDTRARESEVNAKKSETNAKLSETRCEEILNNLPAEADTQIARVTSEGDAQVGIVTSEGNKQVARVTAEGDTQFGRLKPEADRAMDSADKAQASADKAKESEDSTILYSSIAESSAGTSVSASKDSVLNSFNASASARTAVIAALRAEALSNNHV